MAEIGTATTGISDTTIPYEILIRFDAEGQVAGAHYVARRIVRLDGEVLKDEIGAAQPVGLGPGDAAAGKTLDAVLGAALAGALATIAAREAEIADLRARADAEPAKARPPPD